MRFRINPDSEAWGCIGTLLLIVLLWLLVTNVPGLWDVFTCAASRGAC